jgi:hypothetical protein
MNRAPNLVVGLRFSPPMGSGLIGVSARIRAERAPWTVRSERRKQISRAIQPVARAVPPLGLARPSAGAVDSANPARTVVVKRLLPAGAAHQRPSSLDGALQLLC